MAKTIRKKLIPACVVGICLVAVVCLSLAALVVRTHFQPRDYPQSSGGFPLQAKWSYLHTNTTQAVSLVENSILIIRTASDLTALEINTGNLIWSRAVGGRVDILPPVYFDGSLYLTNGTEVFSINAKSGKQEWVSSLGLGASTARVLAVSECCLFVDVTSKRLAAYHRVTGDFLWSTPTYRILTGAVESNGILLYVPSKIVRALQAEDGVFLWEDMEANSISSIVLRENTMYLGHKEGVRAYDLQERIVIWRTSLSEMPSSLDLTPDALIVRTDNQLIRISTATGNIEAQINLSYPQAPVMVDGVIYVMEGFSRTIYALDQSLQILGTKQVSPPILLHSEKELMTGSAEVLVIADGKSIYAYGK